VAQLAQGLGGENDQREVRNIHTGKIHTSNYWPVPVTFNVCTDGVAESVTVIAEARVPTALGVKVTVKVHCALAASVEVHGVAPPEVAV